MNMLKNIIHHLTNPDRSVSIDNPILIRSFTDNPDFPYLVSFSRTGSHWLRMIMELYFEKPSLVRAFYYKNATDFTCYHTHDMDLQLRRENVIYLYRNPVETIYSQLSYYKQSAENEDRRRYWTDLYARHLSKWLVQDDFTQKKTIITYEGMNANMEQEFGKVCRHFLMDINSANLEEILYKISKKELKKKTTHDRQVVNLTERYQYKKKIFCEKYSEEIYSAIYMCEPDLQRWVAKCI